MNKNLVCTTLHPPSLEVKCAHIILNISTLYWFACLVLACTALSACNNTSQVSRIAPMTDSDMMLISDGEQAEAEMELSPKQIRFELGTLEGDIEDTQYGRVLSFKGVPYMQAPIAQLRFKPPQELTAWEGVLEAKSFGPICPQKDSLIDESDWMDEDCLSLNMWLPIPSLDKDSDNKSDESIASALDETNGKAVMVWIHGGGFIQGSGSFPLYYGARLASRGNVIVITFKMVCSSSQ